MTEPAKKETGQDSQNPKTSNFKVKTPWFEYPVPKAALRVIDLILQWGLGPLSLLYALVLAYYPSLRLPGQQQLFDQIPLVHRDWPWITLGGLLCIFGRSKYAVAFWETLTRRPPLDQLLDEWNEPLQLFHSGTEPLSLRTLSHANEKILSALDRAGIKTKRELLAKIDPLTGQYEKDPTLHTSAETLKTNIDTLGSLVGAGKLRIARIVYHNFARPEAFRQQVSRSRTRIAIFVVVMTVVLTTFLAHFWKHFSYIEAYAMSPHTAVRLSVGTLNLEDPGSPSEHPGVDLAAKGMKYLGGIAEPRSESAKDLLMWFFDRMNRMPAGAVCAAILDSAARLDCDSTGPFATDWATLQARIDFMSAHDGTDVDKLASAAKKFGDAKRWCDTNYIARNGDITCKILLASHDGPSRERWIKLGTALRDLAQLEFDVRQSQTPLRTMLLSRIWNNTAFLRLVTYHEQVLSKTPQAYQALADSLSIALPIVKAPELFFDSVYLWCDFAITHQPRNPQFFLTRVTARILDFATRESADLNKRESDRKYFLELIRADFRDAIRLGWEPKILDRSGYREANYFQYFEPLGGDLIVFLRNI